mmetsp:Transcript_25263/g.84912  ORF Transcript_25263/g.84912 Transcript_25263/m.84912 type:complete len:210 (+) Transcript_25263:383-1012(+)
MPSNCSTRRIEGTWPSFVISTADPSNARITSSSAAKSSSSRGGGEAKLSGGSASSLTGGGSAGFFPKQKACHELVSFIRGNDISRVAPTPFAALTAILSRTSLKSARSDLCQSGAMSTASADASKSTHSVTQFSYLDTSATTICGSRSASARTRRRYSIALSGSPFSSPKGKSSRGPERFGSGKADQLDCAGFILHGAPRREGPSTATV